jgi:hypothetical protein
MAVAAVPGISEIAEGPKPPFHKSFLTVEAVTEKNATTAVVFRTFGVDDERGENDPANQNPPAIDQIEARRGAFLVDELTVQLD